MADAARSALAEKSKEAQKGPPLPARGKELELSKADTSLELEQPQPKRKVA